VFFVCTTQRLDADDRLVHAYTHAQTRVGARLLAALLLTFLCACTCPHLNSAMAVCVARNACPAAPLAPPVTFLVKRSHSAR